MMINTHCEEKNESFNLFLSTADDCVAFEAVRDIRGGETLLVDYGKDYNNELMEDRKQQVESRRIELEGRKDRNHNFKCSKCGHTCHQRYRLRHFNKCGLEGSGLS
jgi:hypothetical protein